MGHSRKLLQILLVHEEDKGEILEEEDWADPETREAAETQLLTTQVSLSRVGGSGQGVLPAPWVTCSRHFAGLGKEVRGWAASKAMDH